MKSCAASNFYYNFWAAADTGTFSYHQEYNYFCFQFFPLSVIRGGVLVPPPFPVASSFGLQLGPHADSIRRQSEAELLTQEWNLCHWRQGIMLQLLSLPAEVTVFNEISGVEPTALFQEEEIAVKKPQEDIKIMF